MSIGGGSGGRAAKPEARFRPPHGSADEELLYPVDLGLLGLDDLLGESDHVGVLTVGDLHRCRLGGALVVLDHLLEEQGRRLCSCSLLRGNLVGGRKLSDDSVWLQVEAS